LKFSSPSQLPETKGPDQVDPAAAFQQCDAPNLKSATIKLDKKQEHLKSIDLKKRSLTHHVYSSS